MMKLIKGGIMKAKQLHLEFELKDKIHNLSDQKRAELISELKEKMIWANYENSRWGENPIHFKLWRYLKYNQKTAYTWIKEILTKL